MFKGDFEGHLEGDLEGDSRDFRGDFKQYLEGDLLSSSGHVQVRSCQGLFQFILFLKSLTLK